jgi:hypothetical protein
VTVNEDAFWAEIDAHLDLPATARLDNPLVQDFLEVGFTEDEARRGATLMESGRYFGFADVATSLRPRGVAGQTGLTPVMENAVHRIEKRLAQGKRSRLSESAAVVERDGKKLRIRELRTLLDGDTSHLPKAELRKLIEEAKALGLFAGSLGNRRHQQLVEQAGGTA